MSYLDLQVNHDGMMAHALLSSNECLRSDLVATVKERDRLYYTWTTPRTPRRFEEIIWLDVLSRVPAWLDRALERLNELLELRKNWDTYGAKPVDKHSAILVLDLLGQIMQENTPDPTLVPTPEGGIQIEWHVRDIELEIDVDPAGILRMSGEDLRNELAEWDQDVPYRGGISSESLRGFVMALSQRG